MESHARGVENRFSASATPTTKRTTVLDARQVENFLRIVACPGCWDQTGRARSKHSKPSNAAKNESLATTILGLSPLGNRTAILDQPMRRHSAHCQLLTFG